MGGITSSGIRLSLATPTVRDTEPMVLIFHMVAGRTISDWSPCFTWSGPGQWNNGRQRHDGSRHGVFGHHQPLGPGIAGMGFTAFVARALHCWVPPLFWPKHSITGYRSSSGPGNIVLGLMTTVARAILLWDALSEWPRPSGDTSILGIKPSLVTDDLSAPRQRYHGCHLIPGPGHLFAEHQFSIGPRPSATSPYWSAGGP